MKTREFTGRHMAFCVVGFFGTIIAVNLVLAYFAGTTWTGLVAKNGYVASQEYNDVLAKARKQKAMGWQAGLELRDGQLKFDIADKSGSGIEGLAVRAKVKRPTHENEDVDLTFRDNASGKYVAAPSLTAGQWVVDLVAEDQKGLQFRRIFRLVIEPKNG